MRKRRRRWRLSWRGRNRKAGQTRRAWNTSRARSRATVRRVSTIPRRRPWKITAPTVQRWAPSHRRRTTKWKRPERDSAPHGGLTARYTLFFTPLRSSILFVLIFFSRSRLHLVFFCAVSFHLARAETPIDYTYKEWFVAMVVSITPRTLSSARLTIRLILLFSLRPAPFIPDSWDRVRYRSRRGTCFDNGSEWKKLLNRKPESTSFGVRKESVFFTCLQRMSVVPFLLHERS